MRKIALALGFLALSACGGPNPDDVDSKQSGLVPPSGSYCTQSVNGNCVTSGNPIALASWLCNDGTGNHVFTLMTSFQQQTDGTNFSEHLLPKNVALDPYHLYADFTGGFPGEHPYRDMPMTNTGFELRNYGSNGGYVTRYGTTHTDSVGAFLELTVKPGNGSTYGRWLGGVTIINNNTYPALGICSSYIPFDFTI